MTRQFTPVERTTVSQRVRDEIRIRIVSGELQPGTQLPAERVLAEQFGVARTSVREAIQGLVALGLVERRGNRSLITERVSGAQLPQAPDDRRTIRVLLEARQVLELSLLELAAARATTRERSLVLNLAMQPVPASLHDFALADREFHARIASTCGNQALLEVYGRILETISQAEIPPEMTLGITRADDPAAAITAAANEHRTIAEAFAARDIERMLAAVERHLGPVPGMPGRRFRYADRPEGFEAYAGGSSN